jgi:hypothetical protein
MRADNKQLKKRYQQTPRAMGVFLIRNNLNDKVLLGVGVDLQGVINRNKFQLSAGIHPNKLLQTDWNQQGGDNFSFEIVDQLPPVRDQERDYREELAVLETLWLDRLQPFGARGYNIPKLGRAQMLRRMAVNHSHDFDQDD